MTSSLTFLDQGVSHVRWTLRTDFLARRLAPDIPLWILSLAVQLLDVFWAIFIYLARSRPLTVRARYSIPVFGVAMLLMQSSMLITPPPPSGRAMAATALVAYAVFAGLIAWLESGRAQ